MVISEIRPPWPPDELLELVGMTRDEWDRMAESIEQTTGNACNIPWDWLIESAVVRAARKRADERRKGE